jgi:hypothetical protein
LAETASLNAQQGNPDYGNFLNTLGVAQYRVGQLERALDTLTRSNQLHGNRETADLAFLALTQHRLGQTEASRASLKRLREVMITREAAANAENQAFLREAEVLIELDPAFPADPFAH